MDGEIITEYGVPYKSGDVKIRASGPGVEEVYPLAEWLGHQLRAGGRVLRRRVVVVEDWVEVTEP